VSSIEQLLPALLMIESDREALIAVTVSPAAYSDQLVTVAATNLRLMILKHPSSVQLSIHAKEAIIVEVKKISPPGPGT
jgi:hypothetical protein